MDAEFDTMIQMVQLVRLKLHDLKIRFDPESPSMAAIEDAEMALVWSLRKLEKAKAILPRENG